MKQQLTSGVLIGIVTKNDDPDGLGRIKVKIPLLEDENESDWLRVMSPFAGGERGSYFIPDIDDEVLLSFHLGDMNRPFVLGTLWNSKQKPPVTSDERKQNYVRKIKTKAGHTLLFNDDDSKGCITIETKGGHTLLFDDAAGKITLRDKQSVNEVVLDGQGQKLTLTNSGGTIEMSATAIKVDGNAKIELKAPQIEIKADAQLMLEAGAKMELKSSGLAEVKGTLLKLN